MKLINKSPGGHLRPGFPSPELISKYGLPACVEIALFEQAHMPAIQSIIRKHNIECDFTLTRCHTISTEPAVSDFIRDTIGKYTTASEEIARENIWIEGEEAEKETGVKGTLGTLRGTAAHLWPYKLFLGLLQVAVDGGVNLQTNTPVLSSSSERDGEGYWNFKTERGTIKAKKVVFATNGYTAGILPEYRDCILPRRACCSYISTPTSRSSSGNAQRAKRVGNGHDSSYCIAPPAGGFDYLIQRPDGDVVVGGGSVLYRGVPGVSTGSYDDSKLIPQLGGAVGGYFDGYLKRWFKEGGDGEKLEMVWSGSEWPFLNCSSPLLLENSQT